MFVFLTLLGLGLFGLALLLGYGVWSPGQASSAPGKTYQTLPAATPVANTASGAAQSNAAVLPAATSKMTFIEGFDVTGGGATAASIVEVSITGLDSAIGTLKFEVNVAAGVTASINAQGGLFVRFPTPLPASALNSAITVTLPSLGAGNTNASVTAYGFQV